MTTAPQPALPSKSDALARGRLVPPGLPFFQWVTEQLVAEFDLVYAHVSEPVGDAWDKQRVLAGIDLGATIELHEEELRGTPCEQAYLGGECWYSENVANLFPIDVGLVRIGAESYYGAVLSDSTGTPSGMVTVIANRKIPDFSAIRARVDEMRPRLVGELETRAVQFELETLVQGSTLPSTGSIFAALALTIARALRSRTAFVAQFLPSDPRHVETLGLVVDGAVAPNRRIALEHCPSDDVYNDPEFGAEVFVVSSGVRQRYPNHQMLQELNAEAYMAVGIRDSLGAKIGHLGIVHDAPMHDRARSHHLLRMIAVRAGFEIERHRKDEQRVTLERKLMDAQRLESLGLLAGGVAHDFNNLLVGILGNASLAVAELDPSSPVQSHLSSIEAAAQQAADLARQMLAYSGRGRFDVRSVDLNGLVRETTNLLQRSISRKIHLLLDPDPAQPAIQCDASQIRQVVMNLALNAAEAIGDRDGTIEIRTRLRDYEHGEIESSAHVPALEAGTYASIEVRDTGCGMEPTTLARIFDPFYTTKFTGRGLGLATVHGIVRSHRGAITVESSVGAGSWFRVLLPATTAKVIPKAPTERSGMKFPSGGSILVIDDEPLVRSTSASMLQHLGLDPIVAECGASGIELFQAHRDRIRAVLLDLTMPDMDGVEVYRALKAIDPTVRVILMTGFDERDTLGRFGGIAAPAFLGKPFRAREVLDRLLSVLADAPNAR